MLNFSYPANQSIPRKRTGRTTGQLGGKYQFYSLPQMILLFFFSACLPVAHENLEMLISISSASHHKLFGMSPLMSDECFYLFARNQNR